MLTRRIIGAFLFRKGVYAEVEKDTEFTSTAWILVVVVSFLSQLGKFAGHGFGGLGKWLISAFVGTIFAVIGFALGAWVISLVGKALFKAQTSFDEMVRTLGLAYVWNLVGLIGIVAVISSALACVLAPIAIISALLALVAWLIAAKEALDLDWGRTVVTVIVGWIVTFLITMAATWLLGLFGIRLAAAR
jgi:Yip1 domain